MISQIVGFLRSDFIPQPVLLFKRGEESMRVFCGGGGGGRRNKRGRERGEREKGGGGRERESRR